MSVAPLVCALLVPLAACGDTRVDWPRLEGDAGVDAVLLERIREVEAACERGEPGSLLELAKTYDGNDLNLLAVRTYDVCLALPPEVAGAPAATVHFLRGRALTDLGRADEARRAFDAAVAARDDYAPLRWRRGDLLLEAGRMDDALADYRRALELEPDSVPASLGLARVLLEQDEPGAAIAILRPVLERKPTQRFVHGLLARAHLALGDEDAAAEELRLEELATTTAAADPLSAEVRKRATGVQAGVTRADNLLAEGQPREALKILRPLYRKVPDDLALLQTFAKCLVVAGEHDRALEVLERGRAVHPRDSKLQHFTGLALSARGAHGEALAHLARARELNPGFSPTHKALGEVQLALGRGEEAEASMLRAIELGDEDLSTLVLLAQVQARLAAWKRASATYLRACERFPDAASNWVGLAEARARAGEPDAATALDEAMRRAAPPRRVEAVRKLIADAGDAGSGER